MPSGDLAKGNLENLLREKLQDLSPTKRRLLQLFLEGDDLEASLLEAENEHIQPSTATEIELAEIWQEVLDLRSVGVQDNFFDLGGDSILSIRIVAKANRLGMPLTSRQLFENPTIGALAALVDSQDRRPDTTESAVAAPASHVPGARWTPEDFPEAELDSDDLEQILRQVARRSARSASGEDPRVPAGVVETAALRVAGEMPRPLVLRSARY